MQVMVTRTGDQILAALGANCAKRIETRALLAACRVLIPNRIIRKPR